MFCSQCGAEIQEGAQFCPNCGNRVEQVPAPGAEQMSAPETGQMPVPVEKQIPASVAGWMPGKNKRGLAYAGIGAAALLLLALVVAGAYNLILGKGGRLLAAIDATAKEAPLLVEDLRDAQEILSGDQFLVGVEAGMDDGSLKGEFRNGKKDKQIYISVHNEEYDNLAFLCGVHAGVLRASAEGLDYAFFYDPKQKNEGFLSEDFREKELERLNGLLEGITSDGMSAKAIRKNAASAMKKEFRSLDFEKAAARSWKVNGKERKCKGYQVALDEDDIIRFWEAFSEATQKDVRGETKDMVEEVLDVVLDEVKDLDFDTNLSFYLYKGKLAAVVMENDYTQIRVEFRGGDYRMQNIVVVVENDYFSEEMTISSARKGKTETTTIAVDDEEISIVYNAKSGEVSIASEMYGERYSIEGVYKHSGSEVSYTLDHIAAGGSELDVRNLTIYARKNPGIEKYKGEKFDLGNASLEDFEKLAEDMEDYIDAAGDLLW